MCRFPFDYHYCSIFGYVFADWVAYLQKLILFKLFTAARCVFFRHPLRPGRTAHIQINGRTGIFRHNALLGVNAGLCIIVGKKPAVTFSMPQDLHAFLN